MCPPEEGRQIDAIRSRAVRSPRFTLLTKYYEIWAYSAYFAATSEAVSLQLRLAGGASAIQFLQKPGQYPVGLKVVDQYDRSPAYPAFPENLSKSSAGEDARPLQTLIWYPSLRSTGKPMTVGDYAQLADAQILFVGGARREAGKRASSGYHLRPQRFLRFVGECRSI